MSQNLNEAAKRSFSVGGKDYNYYSLKTLTEKGFSETSKLPYSIVVLVESVLRKYDGSVIKDEHIESLVQWDKGNNEGIVLPFKPSRVILEDFTGVPAVVEFASLRKAMDDVGGDVQKIIPEV